MLWAVGGGAQSFNEGDVIPFEITANDPFYSSENMERLRRSAAQMEQTGGTIHEIGALQDND